MYTVAVCIQIHSYSFTHVNIQDIPVTLTNLSSERKLYIETWTLTKHFIPEVFIYLFLPISHYIIPCTRLRKYLASSYFLF